MPSLRNSNKVRLAFDKALETEIETSDDEFFMEKAIELSIKAVEHGN